MSRTSRRVFLRNLAGLGGGVGALWLASCGPGGPTAEEIAVMAEAYDPNLDCSSTIGLFPAEIKARTDNEYMERSPKETEVCFICINYEPPKQPGNCATCRTVKGPINPLGWCNAWTARS